MSCSNCNCTPCNCVSVDASNEALVSQVNNLIISIFGSVTKTVSNGQVIWTLPCDLQAGVTGFPRGEAEGTNCYLLRLFSYLNGIVSAFTLPLPISSGGTGAISAPAARTSLGLAIGSNVQAYSAALDAWAAITPGAGVGTFLATPSSANLAAAVTGETGTGALVFGTSPSLTTPIVTNPDNTTQTLTDGANIAWDMNSGGIAAVTLGGNRTMSAPTNLKKGTYILKVIQDGTGSRTLTWNALFKWSGGSAPTLTTTAGRTDVMTFYCDGTSLFGAAILNFT